MVKYKKKNYYAVQIGRKPGIYTSWESCKENIEKFSNAVFKGFFTLEEAKNYMRSNDGHKIEKKNICAKYNDIFKNVESLKNKSFEGKCGSDEFGKIDKNDNIDNNNENIMGKDNAIIKSNDKNSDNCCKNEYGLDYNDKSTENAECYSENKMDHFYDYCKRETKDDTQNINLILQKIENHNEIKDDQQKNFLKLNVLTYNKNESYSGSIAHAYIDGSHNEHSEIFGCGGFIVYNNKKYILQYRSYDEECKEMRNVAGEILGVIKVIDKAIQLKIQDALPTEPLFFNSNYLCSKISKLKIISYKFNKNDIEKEGIAFTPNFNKMIDLIHFGICTSTPLIFEGFPGQGKKKAINYVSKLMGYEVENIVITSNFTSKDLFKKTIIQNFNNNISINDVETKLTKILNSKSTKEEKNKEIKNILFVFHNIEKADSNVLSKISKIFNEKDSDTSYLFIGLINIKKSFIETETYYYKYFYKSIYYIVNSKKEIEFEYFKNIIPKNIQNEAQLILNYFNKYSDIYTLSDYIKYIELKKIKLKEINFEDSFIEEIIKHRNLLYEDDIKNKNFNIYKLSLDYIANYTKFKMELNINFIRC